MDVDGDADVDGDVDGDADADADAGTDATADGDVQRDAEAGEDGGLDAAPDATSDILPWSTSFATVAHDDRDAESSMASGSMSVLSVRPVGQRAPAAQCIDVTAGSTITASGSAWNEVTVTATAPTTTVSAFVMLENYRTAGSSLTTYWDQICALLEE